MLKPIALLLFLIQFVGSIYAAQQVPNGLESQLAARVTTYNLTADNFVDALVHLASDFKIPMGIVWINKPSAKAEVNLSWAGATLQEIIEELANTQGYKVLLSNGVVHVTSPEVPPSQDFLLIKINEFVANDQVLALANRNLQHLVNVIISPPNAQSMPIGSGGSMASNTAEPKIDVQVKQATVEEILDLLTKVSVSKIWIVTFEDSFILTSGGFRRTLSLWSNSPVSDNEQPVWDMFGWDSTIPSKSLKR